MTATRLGDLMFNKTQYAVLSREVGVINHPLVAKTNIQFLGSFYYAD